MSATPENHHHTLIKACWIIPITPSNTVIEKGAVAISNGKIDALLTAEQLPQHSADQTVELTDHVIMPGMINAHGHTAMSLLRGFADDLSLMDWLQNHIWPAEGTWVSEEFVRDGTQIAIAEMLRSGTTCFSDMYFFPNVASEVAHTVGVRAQIAFPVFDMPSAWGQGSDDYIHKGLQLVDQYRHSDLVDIAFGPHAPYTVADDALERITMLAEELDANIQMHVHETAQEVSDSLSAHDKRPLKRLADIGLLSPRTQCVHMTQVDDQDIELLGEYGTHVIHCPESNLKLASGFCPVDRLQSNGINVALGTDGAASNNTLDLFGEMRTAALLAKALSGNAAALPAQAALEMATLNGAKALGIDALVGSLEPGKCADLIAINMSSIEQQPLYDPISQLAYTQCAPRVEHAWVNGTQVLRDRHPTTLNLLELTERAQHWHDRIANGTPSE